MAEFMVVGGEPDHRVGAKKQSTVRSRIRRSWRLGSGRGHGIHLVVGKWSKYGRRSRRYTPCRIMCKIGHEKRAIKGK